MLAGGSRLADRGMGRGAASRGYEPKAENQPREPAWCGRRSSHNQLDGSGFFRVACPPNQALAKALTAAIVSWALMCTIACMPSARAAAT